MSWVTSSGPGRSRVTMAAASGSCSRSDPHSIASNPSGPSLPVITTWRRSGNDERRPASIPAWSKPRKRCGTTATLLPACASMNDSSRSRKMGISGLSTAPMRAQARYSAVTSQPLGSWHDTTSLRATPSRLSPTAIRATNASSCRHVKRRTAPLSTCSDVIAGPSGARARWCLEIVVDGAVMPQPCGHARRAARRNQYRIEIHACLLVFVGFLTACRLRLAPRHARHGCAR